MVLKSGELKFFDKIENIKTKQYRVGIKALNNISAILPEAKFEHGLYILIVNDPMEVAKTVQNLTSKGALIVKIEELDNPLQDFFEEG